MYIILFARNIFSRNLSSELCLTVMCTARVDRILISTPCRGINVIVVCSFFAICG